MTPELPPIPWTRSNGDSVMGFELHRADIAERLMQPLPIIEHFDELKHLRLGLLPRVVVPLMRQFVFERTEEALDDGIVVAVALAAHAGHETGLLHQPLVRHAGVQRALIGVMDQAGLGAPLSQRAPELHGAIPLLRGRMELPHAFHQDPIGLRAGTRRASPPRIVPAPAHLQGGAEARQAVLGLMRTDELISHPDSLAKYMAAF